MDALLHYQCQGSARDQLLNQPLTYLERVVGRDLDAAEAVSRLPKWQCWVNYWINSEPAEAMNDAIESYRRFQREGLLNGSDESLRALAILLAEAGNVPEADQELGKDQDDAQFKKLFHSIYIRPQKGKLPVGSRRLVQEVSPDWARDKIKLRLAERDQDHFAAQQIRTAMTERGRALQNRITAISLINGVLVAAGVVAI
jgi:hypothetical protein